MKQVEDTSLLPAPRSFGRPRGEKTYPVLPVETVCVCVCVCVVVCVCACVFWGYVRCLNDGCEVARPRRSAGRPARPLSRRVGRE